MTQEFDCKGLPCPQPVLKCKQVIEESAPEALVILVDNDAAKDNVSRFMGTKGYEAKVEKRGDLWAVTGTRTEAAAPAQAVCEQCEIMSDAELAKVGSKICVFAASETVGSGDDVLGGKLMLNFLATLPELGQELWRIVLVNGGVKLTAEGNPCLEKLQALEKAGVDILVCGTCLEHFGLMEARRVGQTTNMLDVVTSLQLATKVIKP